MSSLRRCRCRCVLLGIGLRWFVLTLPRGRWLQFQVDWPTPLRVMLQLQASVTDPLGLEPSLACVASSAGVSYLTLAIGRVLLPFALLIAALMWWTLVAGVQPKGWCRCRRGAGVELRGCCMRLCHREDKLPAAKVGPNFADNSVSASFVASVCG